MPMNATQLAALVDRARQKPPPVVNPPSPAPPRQRMVPPAKTVPASPAPEPTPTPSPPPAVPSVPQASSDAEPDDFPIGWALTKESWHFHRRFFRIFRRPMHRGEYSHLLWQIRLGRAEHLWEDCWRVTLPNGRGSLPVRATRWYLITILPKDWQPPVLQQP